MSMIFEDRISAYPNRYTMTDENGNASHVILERADEPTIPGTPLNAETFNEMQESIERNVSDMVDDHLNDTDNPHSVTREQIGAAPAGYGLGTDGQRVSSWNDVTLSGFFQSTSNSPNGAWWHGIVCGDGDKNATQFAFMTSDSAGVISAQRKIKKGTPGEWEWVNPPLYTNTEYRTTERFGGKPVYVMRPNIGTGSSVSKAVPFAKNVDCLVRIEGYWNAPDGSMKIPFTTAHFVDSVYVDKYADDFRLRVDFNTNTTTYNGDPVIYYTKTS